MQKSYLAFLCPLAHFKEEYSSLFFNLKPLTVPQIVATDENGNTLSDLIGIAGAADYHVIVENLEVGSTGDFIKAIMMMMSTYFIFNIAYPKEVQWYLTFLQKAVLEMHGSALRIQAVIKFIAELQNA